MAHRYGVVAETGVLITHVTRGSQAYEKNLRPGDIIKEINGKRVTNIEDYRAEIEGLEKGDIVRLWVKRGEGSIYVALKLGQ